MSNLFWLTDEQLTAVEEAIPKNSRGVKPKRNREVISGIIRVLKFGSRWEDCPSEYGPYTTVHNRFNRWSKAGIWAAILAKLMVRDATDIQCIDSTTVKGRRCAADGKGGPRRRASARSRVVERPQFTPWLTAAGGLSPLN